MSIKILGAICILSVTGGFGYYLAWQYRLEINILRRILLLIDYMESELQYHLTPLPSLCCNAAKETNGIISKIFNRLSEDLQSQIHPDAEICMKRILSQQKNIPPITREILVLLSMQLGQFDLGGQVRCLQSVRNACTMALKKLCDDSAMNGSRYKTLCLCAGAALIIIFI